MLIALDAHHLAAGIDAALDAEAVAASFDDITARLREIWRLAADAFGCKLVQQTALPVHPPLLGSNEHRLAGSRAAFVARLNALLR